MIASVAMIGSGRRRAGPVLHAAVLFALVVDLAPPTAASAATETPSAGSRAPASMGRAPTTARSEALTIESSPDVSPSPPPTPGPIVPRSNPLGKVGVVAMVVVAAAGLWIYRVIRKGL